MITGELKVSNNIIPVINKELIEEVELGNSLAFKRK